MSMATLSLENPWKDKDSIPYPKTIQLIPAALMYLLAALTPVFFMSEAFSLIALLGLSVGAIYLFRIPRSIAMVLLTAFVPIVIVRVFSISALLLSIIVGTAAGAVLCTTLRNPSRTVILPAIAWVTAFAVTKDAALASLTLITLPASLALAISTLQGARRTSVICCTIGGLLASVCVLLAVYFTATYGKVDAQTIAVHFENQRVWVVSVLEKVRDQMIQTMAAQGQSAEAIDAIKTVMTHDFFVNLVAATYNILPALIVIVCSVVAFEAQTLLCSAYFTLGMRDVLTLPATAFTMSTVSAILYLVAFAITSLVPATGMLSAVMQNFYLMLTPGFLLIGFSALLIRFRLSKGMSKLFLGMLIGACLLLSLGLLSFYGAFAVLMSALGRRMMRKMKDQMMGGNPFAPGADDPRSDAPIEDAFVDEEEPKEETKEEPKEESKEETEEEPEETESKETDQDEDLS